MAERKKIATISVITDSDNGYDNIGDCDGGFSESELRDHINRFGHEGLCTHLAFMQFQVWDTYRKLNSEKSGNEAVSRG